MLGSEYRWEVNYVNSANEASQQFTGGYNIGNIQRRRPGTLNGYDVDTYDLPDAFWNARLNYPF